MLLPEFAAEGPLGGLPGVLAPLGVPGLPEDVIGGTPKRSAKSADSRMLVNVSDSTPMA